MDHQVAALPLDLFALARWIAYAATMVTIGGGVCAWLLGTIPEPDGRRNLALDAAREITWRLAVAAPIVLIGAHLLRLYGQARAFLEPAEPEQGHPAHRVRVRAIGHADDCAIQQRQRVVDAALPPRGGRGGDLGRQLGARKHVRSC